MAENQENNTSKEQNLAKKESTQGNPPENRDNWIPKSRFDEVLDQRKKAEHALEEIASELAEEIPEDMRDLIPNISATEKIKWLRSAIKKGLFSSNPASSSPDSKRPNGKPPVDFSTLNPTELIAMGYGSSNSKK